MKKRIIKSIFNQLSRTLLLCVVLIVLFVCLCSSYIMKNTASGIKETIYSYIKPKVALRSYVDFADKNSYANHISTRTADIYKSQSSLENYIKEYSIDLSTLANSDYVLYSDTNMLADNRLHFASYTKGKGLLVQSYDSLSDSYIKSVYSVFQTSIANSLPFTLASVSRSEDSFTHYGYDGQLVAGRYFNEDEIENGAYKIILYGNCYYTDGTNIEQVNVGDFITYSLYKDNYAYSVVYKDGTVDINSTINISREIINSYDFEVIGIIDSNSYYMIDDFQVFNFNLIPEKIFLEIMNQSNEVVLDDFDTFGYYYGTYCFTPTVFELKSFNDLEPFIDLINELNDLNKNYYYETNADKYISFVSNIEGVYKSFDILFIFSLCACALILFFLIIIDCNNHKKEIGILKTMGETNKNICIQFFFEYLVIILFCFIVSFIIALLLSNNISSNILDLSALESLEANIKINGSLSLTNVLSLLSITLIVAIPSILSTITYITRSNPKEIMLNE